MDPKQNISYKMSSARDSDGSENDRRQGERREEKSDGFAYITSVGWICRREKCRRNGETLFI